MSVWPIIVSLFIGLVIGFFWSIGFIACKYEGGQLLIDMKTRVYRIILDEDLEDWSKQKYVLLRVSTSQQKLKRLNDISEENLEDLDLEKSEGDK